MRSGMLGSTARLGRGAVALVAVALALGWGCASPPSRPLYDYFSRPDRDDPWSGKIHRWQQRERSQRGEDAFAAPASVAGSGVEEAEQGALPEVLQDKYRAFRAEQKRAMAREIAEWIQLQSRQHYVPDGAVDRWATLAETLRGNGDDCDGLELLTYQMLRDLGFGESEVYRSIVYRRTDGQHHMVTLWFEDPDDPWVIDPTGAMTSGMPRMSDVPGWVPLKVFSEDEDFSVERVRYAVNAQRSRSK
jgi:predicted transglutaminase-like cysteine proteinase